VQKCVRHPDAHRLDMKSFLSRPNQLLCRYEVHLAILMRETPPGHEDLHLIPKAIDVLKALGREIEPRVFSARQKVEVWRYHAGLVFKPGESIVRGFGETFITANTLFLFWIGYGPP
jgi:hypothetical protein